MKCFTKLIAVLLLSLTVLLLASCTPSDDDHYGDDVVSDPIEWEVSEDGKTISGGGKTYKPLSSPIDYTVDPVTRYVFHNEIELPFDDYEYTSISSYARSGEIIWASGDDETARVYVTEAGSASLDGFLGHKSERFHLLDASNTRYRSYPASEELSAFEELRKSGVTARIVEVSALKDAPCYLICAYDEHEIFRYDYGAIYEYEDALYYLNYLELDNTYFDADGNFSYRSGQVTLTRLEEHVEESAEELIDGMEYLPYSYTYETVEEEDVESIYDDTTAVVLFWIAYAFLGFACPIPFLVMGFAFPHSEKRGYPKYWYAVGVAAVVWMLAAGGLMLLFIL